MIRPWRPKTGVLREIRRRRKHYPEMFSPRRLPRTAMLISTKPAEGTNAELLRCACDEAFASPEQFERHLEGWMPALSRVRFRYRDVEGGQTARPMPGHHVTVRWRSGDFEIECECGWTGAAPRKRGVGPAARQHIHDVVRDLTNLSCPT